MAFKRVYQYFQFIFILQEREIDLYWFFCFSAYKFQENLLKSMMQIENTFFELGQSSSRDCLIICDRGAMDVGSCKWWINFSTLNYTFKHLVIHLDCFLIWKKISTRRHLGPYCESFTWKHVSGNSCLNTMFVINLFIAVKLRRVVSVLEGFLEF